MTTPSAGAAPSVVVAVLTYRRPDDLAVLLPQLEAQAAATDRDVTVLVVDNDPDAGARTEVERMGGRFTYAHEPTPGIAAARNRALAESTDRDLLIFVDDDERPAGGWLDALLTTFASHDCAGVVGPVVSSFASDLDPWIVAGGFFDRRRPPTGTVLDVAATNNLLLDMRAVRAADLLFDQRFGLAGGSDTLFTRRLVAAGHRLVWCDEAVVTDVVPPSRATRGWVLRRRLRIGNSRSRIALALAGSARTRWRARVAMVTHGAVRTGAGIVRMAFGTASRDVRHRAGGARTLAHGVGILIGACGFTYVEYRRSP